jgi:putative ABC transport system permease protein
MLKNYLKIAFRNLWKNKSFSLINILGLTAGTVCCLYILLYIKEQHGYDKHHHDAGSLYRVRTIIDRAGGKDVFKSACTSPPIAMAMKKDFPEIIAATRVQYFADEGDYLLGTVGSDNSFYESKGYLADSTFFRVFDYKFTEGNPLHCLDEPYTVVLSSAVARKLFGKNSPINEQINISNRQNAHVFKVTGVYDETFGKSHLSPNLIMNMNSGGLGEFIRNNNQWAGQNFIYTYLRLNPNADAAALESKLPAFLQKYGAENLKESGIKSKTLYLQPVTDIYLYSKGIGNQIDAVSDAGFLNLLLTIAIFIQLIACVNFINLTTARSMRRAREIGVRKVVGAGKPALVMQFLGESAFISFIAVILATVLVAVLLPYLNTLTGGDFDINALNNIQVVGIILGLGLVTGLLAGIYPAIYLSGFKPASVLKSAFRLRAPAVFLRKGLVVFQFVTAIVLIIGVITITRQVQFMRSQDLGFNPGQKIVIPLKDDDVQNKATALKARLSALNEINGVTTCTFYPSKKVLSDRSIYTTGHNMTDARNIRVNRVDEDYFKVMGIQLIAGRNISRADSNNQVVVNEAVLRALDLKKEGAIGAKLYNENEGNRIEYEIVGITKDYNFYSLKEDMIPLMTLYVRGVNYLIAETKTANYKQALADIGTAWKEIVPGVPLEYTFLDADLQKLYVQENTLQKISNSFTLLAIIISCLGLFGLAMFTAQQRIKEIGVRKVLGASVGGIISMLSKDFLKLVFVAIVIACPIAWWLMTKWLEDFAYKTAISWWIFGLAGVLALLIAAVTVSFQAIKAAVANPVKSLRTE